MEKNNKKKRDLKNNYKKKKSNNNEENNEVNEKSKSLDIMIEKLKNNSKNNEKLSKEKQKDKYNSNQRNQEIREKKDKKIEKSEEKNEVVQEAEELERKIQFMKEEANNKKKKSKVKNNGEKGTPETVKNEIKENNEIKELVEIGKELKNKNKLSIEEQRDIQKKLLPNLWIAITIMIYGIFLILGMKNIKLNIFINDLKVFSIILISLTILIFEIGYKKDSGKFAIYGIEILILSISTFIMLYLSFILTNKFSLIIAFIVLVYGIYYCAKCIIIYVKEKNKIIKQKSDIQEIIKE